MTSRYPKIFSVALLIAASAVCLGCISAFTAIAASENFPKTDNAIPDSAAKEDLLSSPYAILPGDYPMAPMVIQKRRFPLEKKLLVELGPEYLYGDKFLDTFGVLAQLSYFWRERWGFSFRAGYYFPQFSDDALTLLNNNTKVLTYDPQYTLLGSVLYAPFYGKISGIESLIRFKIYGELGAHFTSYQIRYSPAIEYYPFNESTFGGNLGIGALVFINEQFTLNIKADFHLDPAYHYDYSSGIRILRKFSILGGIRF